VKNILDEIRQENVIMIPGEKREGGRKEKDIFCHGGLGGCENGVQRTADGVELLVAEIVVRDGGEKEQEKEEP
jgi:hypothetical protein